MKQFLATKLTIEQCAQRLHNTIDPVPTPEERLNTAPNTTWAPDPLPGAGQRTTGFGYSPGTRPVVGTIQDGTFHLEKRVAQSSYGHGPNATPIIGATCTGRLQPAPYGTLIELEMERPSSSVLLIFVTGLFAVVFGLIGLLVLSTYLTGIHPTPPTSKGDAGGFGSCILVLLFVVPLVLSLIAQQTGNAEREYILKLVKLVCQATPLAAQKVSAEEGYTGKTGHLS
jgi:hypothetical protein